jgi:hypothetical protein
VAYRIGVEPVFNEVVERDFGIGVRLWCLTSMSLLSEVITFGLCIRNIVRWAPRGKGVSVVGARDASEQICPCCISIVR